MALTEDLLHISDDDEEIVGFIEDSNFFNRQFQERTDYFYTMRDSDFVRRFRLTKTTALVIIDKIGASLEHATLRNMPISPMNQLLCTLRFFATGSQLITSGDIIRVHESTACRIVHRVTEALARLYPDFIRMPSTEEEINEVVNDFYNVARFPRVIGAIDCTHIKINSPGGQNAEIYRNRKGYFSINVQAISSSKLMFTDIVARWHGSAHDSNIWDNCNQRRTFLQGVYGNKWLVGDSGYGQTPFMMVPITTPILTERESLYNESQIRTRNVIERVFGVWKRRFPILARGIQVNLRRVPGIIVACAVLHNICVLQKEDTPPEDPEYPVPPEPVPPETETESDSAVNQSSRNISMGQQQRQNLIENYFSRLG